MIKRSTLDFNKEMILAELGSFVCTPAVAFLTSRFTKTPKLISFGAVAGGIIGSSLMFVATRLWDKNRHAHHGKYASRELIGDLVYLTPVAFVLALIMYYPIVFYLSRYLLTHGDRVVFSAVAGQLGAFTAIAICLNIYRIILRRRFGKEL
jgi:hypothetical protein